MGLGDRLKGLRDQAEQVVADNKDKIHGAVNSVGDVANEKTKGKYADKITKMREKVSSSVERFGADARDPSAYAETTAAEVPEAPEAFHHPQHDEEPLRASDSQPAGDDAPAAAPPEFE